MSVTPLLRVADLRVAFPVGAAPTDVVRGVTFELDAADSIGLVGESGSGKTMIASALLDLVPPPGHISGGRIEVAGHDVVTMRPAQRRRLRGGTVGMVFQDPLTGLNPVRTIGSLLGESVRRHRSLDRRAARDVVVESLRDVGIPAPTERLNAYPHELSGGLRQRVMIALALINRPQLIIADEPTTALDTTIQAQILDLLAARIADAGLVLITHDLGVAAQMCRRLAVVYHGRIVEFGKTANVLQRPQHPYTAGLLDAAPRFDPQRRPLTPIFGSPPAATADIVGCSFAARCPRVTERCRTDRPLLTPVAQPSSAGDGQVACWHPHVDRFDKVSG